MKRKINEHKVYELIGRATTIILANAMWVGIFIYGFMHATTLN